MHRHHGRIAGNVVADVLRDRARPDVVLAAGPEADQELDGLAFVEFGRRLGGRNADAAEQQADTQATRAQTIMALIPDVLQEPLGRNHAAHFFCFTACS